MACGLIHHHAHVCNRNNDDYETVDPYHCEQYALTAGYEYAIATCTSRSVGSICQVKCAPGYSGTVSVLPMCQEDKKWRAASGCTQIVCPLVSNIPGESRIYNNPLRTVGSTCTVTCTTGYIGNQQTLTCGANGAWSTYTACTCMLF